MAKGFGKKQQASGNIKGQKAYRDFLYEILWATAESAKSPEFMFRFISRNQNKLNDGFVEFLRQWVKPYLAKESLKKAELMAMAISNFSTHLFEYSVGNVEINFEVCLAGYEVAMTVLTREFSPQEWGLNKKNTASLCRRRIRGDRSENLEKAIAACQEALQVLTRETFPKEWAITNNTFGLVYSDRIKGDIAENQEKAIACYKAALEVFTREVSAREWGRLHHNLGLAYKRRIKGNLQENQETAIAYYEAALEVRTREAFPEKWAQTQADLGIVYSGRLTGDPRENIEKAIGYYKAALEIYTPTFLPAEFSFFQRHLLAANKFRDDLDISGKEIAFILQIFQAIDDCILLREPNQKCDRAANTVAYQAFNGEQEEVDDRFLKSLDSNAEMGNFVGEKAFYTFLYANLEKLDDNFIELFRNWATIKVSTVDRDEAERIAMHTFLFSCLIQKFTQGNIAINLEIAITGYEIFSSVCSGQQTSIKKLLMAEMLCNLSFAYRERIRGNKADNVEKAISLCQTALNVVTRDNYPQLWANLQNNLAGGYGDRIYGEKAENIEKAIQHFKAALEVFTRKLNPFVWAGLKHNLGDAYAHRIKGDRLENMELAIKYIEASLEVYAKDKYPKEWANNQNTLGFVYSERVKGDRQENLEKTIKCYQAALQVLTASEFPQLYGQSKMNLANSYRDRLKGNPIKNLEMAIVTYHDALKVLTKEAFPERWATIQNNLGIAYSSKILGSFEDFQKLAIIAYKAALQIFTEETFPQQWAMAQKNLGITYANFINGNAAENLDKAMTAHQAAARVFTRDAFPKYWGRNQTNMAIAYSKLANIDKAIACCHSALELFVPTTFPMECLTTAHLLGEISFKTSRWAEAIEGYGIAIEAVETTRTWTPSESRRQEIVENAIGVYRNMVQACINAGNLEKALEYAERSKSKLLVDIMASNDRYQTDNIPPEVEKLLQQYNDLQQQIDRERRQQTADTPRETRTTDRASFHAYNQIVDRLESEKQNIWEQLRRLDPVLAGEIQVSAPDIAAMQRLIDKPTSAILSFYNTSSDTHIFILRQDSISLHTCPQQGVEGLQRYIAENWLSPYLEQSEGFDRLDSILDELGDRLQLNNLIAQHLHGIEELIIVPHLLLHLIPFGAIALSDSPPRCLGDKFLIRYAPSCQILEFCHQRGEVDIETFQYGIVEDAEDNLHFAAWEGDRLAELLGIPETNRLRGKSEATCHNYRQLAEKVQVLHSCHHAESRLDKPLESVLKLGDGNITLGQLMSPGWRLPHLSDVFLSCCETGLGMPPLTDDILTLAAGFLCAGARSVVNTLWSVDDLATALVCTFYYRRRQQGESRPQALWGAQMDLCNFTKDDFKELSRQVEAKRKDARSLRKQYREGSAEYEESDREYKKYLGITNQLLNIQNSSNPPFSHPQYWAAFTCQGLS